MKLTTLAKAIETELNKSRTDRETFDTVCNFWSYTGQIGTELLLSMIDKIKLLESRMLNQHGWAR